MAGPTLSLRGLDAPAYYVLDRHGSDVDITGCGNTLNPASPTVVRLVTDSMRYFATELGVDGFRLDLASALGRPHGGRFDPNSPLLTAITDRPRAGPVQADRRAVGRHRRTATASAGSLHSGRSGTAGSGTGCGTSGAARVGVRDLAYRLSGSEDLYAFNTRRPWASINFVTAHDGFTLRDLVSYDEKHNEANGEHNRDGTDRQPLVELRGRRRDRRPGGAGAARPAGAQPARHAAAVHRHADAVRGRRAVAHPGRQQQPVLPGRRDVLGGLDAGRRGPTDMLAFARRVIALRAGSPALRQPEFFDGRPSTTGQPTWCGSRPTARR